MFVEEISTCYVSRKQSSGIDGSLMHEAPDPTQNDISKVMRRTIIDTFTTANISWAGRLQIDEFLARLHDLSKLPSFDHRYKSAVNDIYQHTYGATIGIASGSSRPQVQFAVWLRCGIPALSLRDRARNCAA
jgi:hypothetical protein